MSADTYTYTTPGRRVMTPEETLMLAAEDMSEHGLCKETFYAPAAASPGPLKEWQVAPACALGTLARVTNVTNENGLIWDVDDVVNSKAARKLAATIREHHPDMAWYTPQYSDYAVITDFNDGSNTTKEDVVLMFKEAAHG